MNAVTCTQPGFTESDVRNQPERCEQAGGVSPQQPAYAVPRSGQDTVHIGAPDAVARIQQEYQFRVAAVRNECQVALLRGDPTGVIEKVVELVRADDCMVHAMARATLLERDVFDAQRLLRRSDIELLLEHAELVGDQKSATLAESLLKNQQRYLAAALEAHGQATLPGM